MLIDASVSSRLTNPPQSTILHDFSCGMIAIDPPRVENGTPRQICHSERSFAPPVTTAVLLDASRSYSELLADRLERERITPSARVVTTIDEAVEHCSTHAQCLVVTSYYLGGPTVSSLIAALPAEALERLAVISPRFGRCALERLLAWGVAGCLLKTDPLSDVLKGLRTVAHGVRAISPGLLDQLSALPRTEDGQLFPDPLSELNPRQMQVLVMLAQGASVKEVAHQLQISIKTIDSMKYRLMKHLHFHDRVELTRYAIREGLIEA